MAIAAIREIKAKELMSNLEQEKWMKKNSLKN
jgi:hypothetical protein